MSGTGGERCRALLAGPADAARPFLQGGMSHGDLHRLAARLHAHFQARSGEHEGLCLASEDRALCAAAILAALAGGPTLLLPYALSLPALSSLHEAAGCRLALAEADRPLPAGMEPLALDSLPASAPPLPQNPAQGSILGLFTGGSTGSPRIWSKTAENLLGEGFFIAAHYGIGAGDRILATVPVCHIYGLLYGVVLPLVSGASVCAHTPVFPEEMAKTVEETAATVFISVPAHYHALAASDKRLAPCALRLAFSSAGMLDERDALAFAQANRLGIIEVFGSTETGGLATRNRFRGEREFTMLPGLDWQAGADERLMVRSAFLSPELPRDEAGWFHTADRIQPTSGPQFRMLGRADMVVKVGGQRVDMDAVKRLLLAQAGVQDAFVAALPESGSRENRIVAAVAGTASPEALRQALARRLEPYALPRLIRVLGALPMRANGKYDREAMLALLSEK